MKMKMMMMITCSYFQITSYGGRLTYAVSYEVPKGSSFPVLTTKPDVVIEVTGFMLLFN